MASGERTVWAIAFERALVRGDNLDACVAAAFRAVVALRDCVSATMTDDARAMLEDMLGVSR